MRRLLTVSIAAVVFFLLSLALTMVVGRLTPVSTVSAAGGWTAYNDCVYLNAYGVITGNISAISCVTNTSTGRLRNYSTGSYMAITLTVATSSVAIQDTCGSTPCRYGSEVTSGTDAWNMFHGTVAITGGMRIDSGGGYVRLTFTGLSPSMLYEFAGTNNRNDPDYTARTSTYIIGDVVTATSASSISPSPGVTRTTTSFYQDSATFWSGYNTVNGHVARWVNIQPGADGDLVITITNGASGEYGYGPAVFMLREADPTAAELTSLAASPARGQIRLTWDTASDVGRLGFYVYRATSRNGERESLTASLIRSQAPGAASGAHYQFVDETAQPGLTYYYWVEMVTVDGATHLYGPISARVSLFFKPPPARD